MSFKTNPFISLWLALLFVPSLSQANFSFEGYLAYSNNTVVTGTATIRFKVLSPSSEACLLYGEDQTLTVPADGYVALDVGAGTRFDGLAHTLNKAFDNSTTFTGLTCAIGTSYTPTADDKRLLNVTVTVGGTTETLGSIVMNPVPVAAAASNVGGYSPVNLLRVDNGGTPGTAAAFTPPQFTELMNLVNGTSASYAKTSSTVGAAMPVVSGQPSGVTVGSVWYDSTSNQLKYYNGTSAVALTGGGGVSSMTGAAPLVVTGTGALSISMPAANASQNGYLSMTDWTNFNSKLSNALGSGQIWIGNTGVATPTNLTGDANLTVAGALTVTGLNTHPVSASAPTAGQILKYSGSSWVNSSLMPSDISGGSFSVAQGGTGSTSFALNSVIVSNGTGTALQALNCISGQTITFDASGYAVCGVAGLQNNGNAFGTAMRVGTNDNNPLLFRANAADRMVVTQNGFVGINQMSPAARLEVNGAIVSDEVVVSTVVSSIDFSTGNSVVLTSASGPSLALNGMVAGGHYTLVVENAASQTYSFLSGGQCVKQKFSPANGATVASTTTIYEIYFRAPDTCLIRWQSGY